MNATQRRRLTFLLVCLILITVVLLDLIALGSFAEENPVSTVTDAVVPDTQDGGSEQRADERTGVTGGTEAALTAVTEPPPITTEDPVTGIPITSDTATQEPIITSEITTTPKVTTSVTTKALTTKVTTTTTKATTTTTTKVTTTTTASAKTTTTTWHIVKDGSVSATGPKLSPPAAAPVTETVTRDPDVTTDPPSSGGVTTTSETSASGTSAAESSSGGDTNITRSLIGARDLMLIGVVVSLIAIISIVFTLIFVGKA